MALYQGWQHAMEPFHGWRHDLLPFGQSLTDGTAAAVAAASGQTATDLASAYQTGWPGVVSQAGTLATDLTSIFNAASPSPLATQAPPALVAPTPAPATSSSIPWLLIGGAAVVYFAFMR